MSEQAATRSRTTPFEYEPANLTISVNVSDLQLMGFYDPDGNPWMLAETTRTYPGA